MVKLNKKRNNPNSVGAYTCGCINDCYYGCGCSCPATGISSGTVVNELSTTKSYLNSPKWTEHYVYNK
jgi:hypothetical protein